jgi:hypothetical protein
VIRDEKGEPQGRLHIELHPAYRQSDDKSLFVLRLTARIKPKGSDAQTAFEGLDVGHEFLVRAFHINYYGPHA